MSHFSYQDGLMLAEKVSLSALAADVETPFYCYATARLHENYASFAKALAPLNPLIHYAIKACANQAVVMTLAKCGAGADIVSVGEMLRALQAGITPDKIVFSGVGKTAEEISAALIANIYQINVESLSELRKISEIAAARNLVAPVALRINPDVKVGGHHKIETGHKETKFGIEISQLGEAFALIRDLPGLSFKGFTMHVGSDVNDYEPFRVAFGRAAAVIEEWRAKGVTVERFDCGGGVTIPYDGVVQTTVFEEYAAIIAETVGKTGCRLSFEPGRRLVGDAGVLVARVLYVKDTPAKRFVVIDAGMNDLVRPAMYEARHTILPVVENKSGATSKATVVGPICESSDDFGADFDLPSDIKPGDLLMICQAGAYGASMASTYNARPLIPEVLVHHDQYALVRRRISIAEQISWESLPAWL